MIQSRYRQLLPAMCAGLLLGIAPLALAQSTLGMPKDDFIAKHGEPKFYERHTNKDADDRSASEFACFKIDGVFVRVVFSDTRKTKQGLKKLDKPEVSFLCIPVKSDISSENTMAVLAKWTGINDWMPFALGAYVGSYVSKKAFETGDQYASVGTLGDIEGLPARKSQSPHMYVWVALPQ